MTTSQFIDIAYLNIGLVSYGSYMPAWDDPKDSKSLDRCLSTLSPEDQRQVKRKFRKKIRQAAKFLKVRKERLDDIKFYGKQSMVYRYVWKIHVKRDFGNISDNIWDHR